MIGREQVMNDNLSRFGNSVQRIEREAEARGVAAECARWEARIEKLAAWEDRARDERGKVARWHEESGSKIASEIWQDEYRHDYTGRVLRSLLTEEEA